MRKIDIDVSGCDDCPLCRFDGYYDMNVDCGWDCIHPDINEPRIVNEGGYDTIHSCQGVEDRLGKPFPDFCPLVKVDVTK